jgi:hypothetical protein
MTARPAVSLTVRTQKSPRGAGRFGMIGASTLELETFRAGDFRNQVFEEPVMQHKYDGTRSRACHLSPPPRCAHLTYCYMGGVA